jgi:hypothetical protein
MQAGWRDRGRTDNTCGRNYMLKKQQALLINDKADNFYQFQLQIISLQSKIHSNDSDSKNQF